MRRAFCWSSLLLIFAAVALIATPALAQNPTGALTGFVTGPDGAALTGVTVTATSPQMQGAKVVTTDPSGSYKLTFIPPGQYQVTYRLKGFNTSTREVRISAALSTTSDLQMTQQ
ncbi:MAG: carboxypeptidase regulatory-like domain-containing protein [Gammaproteobacteria bacterium]|nr:carboxypeptidase regulatory-like domain-containing protein [Gammaproteobacteria bacterium]